MEIEIFDARVKARGKKRGRPPMLNVRKPIYLLKEDEADSEASSGYQSTSKVKEGVSKKYISVKPFILRGPKSGQKRKPYKKHKTTKNNKVEKVKVQKEKEMPEAKKRCPRKSKELVLAPCFVKLLRLKLPLKKVKFDDSCLEESYTDTESEEGSRMAVVWDEVETE